MRHDLDGEDGACVDCGWSHEHGPCTYDPVRLAGKPIGMFHCPECGTMQLAGLPHTLCSEDQGPEPQAPAPASTDDYVAPPTSPLMAFDPFD